MCGFRWCTLLCLMAGFCSYQVGATETPTRIVKSRDNSVEIIRSVPFSSADDKPILADIYLPTDRQGRLPAILMLHGGAWCCGDKVQIALHARYAAQRGYIVMAINYRLAPRHKFPAQLIDCQAALHWLDNHAATYAVDPERIAAYGYSAGGHLAALLGTAETAFALGDYQSPATLPRLRAIVAGGAPCDFDWIRGDSQALTYWLGGSRDQLPSVYRRASPTCHVDSQDPPVFLFHGESDRVVPLASARRMKSRLEGCGVATELLIIPQGRHLGAFLAPESRRGAIDFLDRILKTDQ